MFALVGSVSMWNGTGYGNTPHKTCNGRGGLTVPSWYADHYLTENIDVVNRDGVYRYHNRNPPDEETTGWS
jgi:hypothetical protein